MLNVEVLLYCNIYCEMFIYIKNLLKCSFKIKLLSNNKKYLKN